MSRLVSRLKLGYYPLPVEEAQKINALLIGSGSFSSIDPCAPDGTAFREITKGSGAHLAQIELDADRAAACSATGSATVHGSAFECRMPAESCSLLYLNPPYDTELGPHSNDRMELVFLEHCYRWLKTEGVLVFVIPRTALGRCGRLLARQFDRLRVFRLEHPESVRFKQVVVFGKRKKAHLRGDPKGADLLVAAGYHPNELPVLNGAVPDRYALPPSAPVSSGSISTPGRKRPLRHLVACSQELADATADGKLLLVSDAEAFVWSSLVRHYGLPATPEWGPWMIGQLTRQKRVLNLPGFGYHAVAVTATRKQLLALLAKGLRSKQLRFPTHNAAVEWPEVQLIKTIG